MKWFPNHGAEQTRPALDKVVAALKAEGVTSFAAVGFCFGGRYVWDLAYDDVIKVAATAHPSLIQIPADLEVSELHCIIVVCKAIFLIFRGEKYASTVKVPLLINSCEFDPTFDADAQAAADAVLGGGKYAPGYRRAHWPGCEHGFALRGDLSNPVTKAGKEGAFKESVLWFHEKL